MHRLFVPVVAVIFTLLLAGCVNDFASYRSPSTHSSATSNSNRFDLRTNTRFPNRHGSQKLDAAKQISRNSFRAGYFDSDSQSSIAYFLTPKRTGRPLRYRGTRDEYIDYFANTYIERLNRRVNPDKQLNFKFYQTDGVFDIETLSSPLRARWILTSYVSAKHQNLTFVTHHFITSYQGMVMMVVVIYRDRVDEQVRKGWRKPPSRQELIDIHASIAREMLEPARTFLR